MPEAARPNTEFKTLFHGSPFTFEAFKAASSGIHFGSYDQAVHAATLKLARIPVDVFMNLEEVNGWRGKIYQCTINLGLVKRISDPRTPQAWSRQISKAKREGYNSIVYTNDYEGSDSEDSYCVFDVEQIVWMLKR